MIAIDLGSNSLRCLQYNEKSEIFEKECEYIVKTADDLYKSKIINQAAIDRIVDSLLDAQSKLDFKYHKVLAVTTEAMRQAKNSSQVVSEIFQKTGIQFEIISSLKEAEFTMQAVEHRLKSLNLSSEKFVLIDVGGGSTEIIFKYHDKIITKSFPIGIVTVAQECQESDEIDTKLQVAFKDVNQFIEETYLTQKPTAMVATAGTPTTMAAYLQGMNYKTYDVNKINGFILSYKDTQKALDDLMSMSEEERKLFVGVGRETLILAGIKIVQKLYNSLGFEESIVIDDGLREGLVLNKR